MTYCNYVDDYRETLCDTMYFTGIVAEVIWLLGE